MKKWVLIDDITTSSAVLDETVLNAGSKNEAVRIARDMWDRMSTYDRKRRDGFFIGLAEQDEDGYADWDTMTDIVDIASIKEEDE